MKVGFPGHYPIDQQGPPGIPPFCSDFKEKFFGTTPPWLDVAYPIPVRQAMDGHGFGQIIICFGQIIICGIGHIGTLPPLKKGIG
jgi:hypothetical protein